MPEPSGNAANSPPPRWMAKTAGARRRQWRRYRTAGQQMTQRQQRNRGKRKSKRTAAAEIRISPGDPEAVLGRDKEKVYRQAVDRLQKQVIERLNAAIKRHRGLRRLSGRGLRRARTQLGLVVLAHELRTLEKLGRKRTVGAATGTPPSPATD